MHQARARSIRVTPNFPATIFAADLAQASPLSEKFGARSDLRLSQVNPAKCQPIVPLRSATTLFGMPALIRDWAPIMLRVRPAQFTTMVVDGEGTMSRTRRENQLCSWDIDAGRYQIRVYSSNGRLSSTLRSVPSRGCVQFDGANAWRAAVVFYELTKSFARHVNAENSTKPDASHAAMPPSRYERSV